MEHSTCASLLVPSTSFGSHPLWSNCVQQFSMWVQSSSAILKRGNGISFTFDNQDALVFCQKLQCGEAEGGNHFDVIFSSNLMDHVGPANLVLSAIPLLTLKGFLFTGTMMYRYTSMTCFDKYLSLCFGFDCKLLPVILGIHCINHEGAGYASPVMIRPSPGRTRPQRLLIWQQAIGQPMCISKLPSPAPGNVTKGLIGSIVCLNGADYKNGDEFNLACNYSIETALLVLETFMSSVNASSTGDYRFCEPLCDTLVLEFKPFLWGLQTQALLHGLHVHFVVDA